MEKTTISHLKAHLSSYLRKVRAGQTILVLDRDEPVARLEPVNATRRDPGFADDRLTRLERAGVLRRGRRRLSVAALREPAPRARASVLEALLEERREGR